MSASLLVIDIGNTNVKAGRVSDGEVTEVWRIPHAETAPGRPFPWEEGPRPVAAAIASVVPGRTPGWQTLLEQRMSLPVWELRTTDPQPIGVDVPEPATVGADRLANAIAAVHRRGSPVMVADFGTALTFDVAVPDRGYIGGAITPGIDLMYQYFSEKTALLPALTFAPCDTPIGSTTAAAMHAGAYYGYRGMVRELSARIREDLGGPVPLIATGGAAAEVLKDFGEEVEVVPHLTLEGIARAWAAAHPTG